MEDFNIQGVKPIYASERRLVNLGKKKEPNYDPLVSKIVGKKILATDGRLIKLIVKWKADKTEQSTRPDDFMNDPEKIKELKEMFA